jgi:DNA-directed RNA polymerase specialized sigma24 family protein
MQRIQVNQRKGDEMSHEKKHELHWIDALLNRWGRWALRCQRGALGYSSCSILASGGDTHTNEDGYHSAEPRGLVDHDIEAVDASVNRLPDYLKIVVLQIYQLGQGKSDRKNAEVLHLHHRTMHKYLYRAHFQIMLDIRNKSAQNRVHSVNGRNALCGNVAPLDQHPSQPVTAQA